MATTTAQERQFCRKGIHTCIPAVTLTFDGGARRLHWCADHADDAEQYRDSSDQKDQGATLERPDACPECGVDLKSEGYPLGHQTDEGDVCTFKWAPGNPFEYDEN